jgi:hypothetical protein
MHGPVSGFRHMSGLLPLSTTCLIWKCVQRMDAIYRLTHATWRVQRKLQQLPHIFCAHHVSSWRQSRNRVCQRSHAPEAWRHCVRSALCKCGPQDCEATSCSYNGLHTLLTSYNSVGQHLEIQARSNQQLHAACAPAFSVYSMALADSSSSAWLPHCSVQTVSPVTLRRALVPVACRASSSTPRQTHALRRYQITKHFWPDGSHGAICRLPVAQRNICIP